MKRLGYIDMCLLMLLFSAISISVLAAPGSNEINGKTSREASGSTSHEASGSTSHEASGSTSKEGNNNNGQNTNENNDQDKITKDDIENDLKSILKCAEETKGVGTVIIQFIDVVNLFERMVPGLVSQINNFGGNIFALVVKTLVMLSYLMQNFTLMALPLIEFRWLSF